MDEIKKMLFSMQRFQVLALYTSIASERTVSDSYAFAWSVGLYPLLNESADWHKAYEECFGARKAQMAELHGYLGDKTVQKSPMTFHELEDHYGVKGSRRPGPLWNQAALINACRYFYLHQQFDEDFWSALLEHGQFPAGAESISRKFDVDDFHFE